VIVRAFKRKAVTAVAAVSVVGGLLAGCSSSSADNDAEKTGEGSQNKVIGASEGRPPRRAPSRPAWARQRHRRHLPPYRHALRGQDDIKSKPTKIAVLSTGQLTTCSPRYVPTATTRADNAGLVPDYLADAFPATSPSSPR